MRFSVWPNPQQPWDDILAVAQHADETGWDGVYFADHFMPNAADVSNPVHECWTILTALAAKTTRVRLGSLVCGNTYRHPAVLAKQAASADIVSKGRIVLGLGAGWQENEHRAYGIPFYDTKERLQRLDEACALVTGLLRNERTSFQGRFYQLEDAPLEPKPANAKMPLLVGGGGEKVTMRIAAQYADEWNVWGTPELLAQKGEVLEGHCQALGRDPKLIKHSAQALLFMSEDEEFLTKRRESANQMPMPTIIGSPDDMAGIVRRYADAGVDELIVPDFTLGPTDQKLAAYDTFLAAARA